MSKYFDNFFTSNMFLTGFDRGLNKDNKLNQKYWYELPVDRKYPIFLNQKGAFFVIKTFSTTDSDIINNSLNSQTTNTIYFDKYGNLAIFKEPFHLNPTTPLLLFENKCAFNKTVNLKNPQSPIDFEQNPPLNSNLILSDQRTFILDRTVRNSIKILYNPMHKKSFKDFYKSLAPYIRPHGYPTPNDEGTNDVQKLVYKYCELMATPNTKSGERNYADPACKCLGTKSGLITKWNTPVENDFVDECIDDVISHDIKQDTVRNSVGLGCVCKANGCLNLPDNSFVKDFVDNVKGALPKCPEMNLTLCNMIVNAGGGIKATNTQLNQTCGNSPEYQAALANQTATTPQQTSTTPQQTSTTPQQTSTTPQQTSTTPQQTSTTPKQTSTTPQQTSTTPQQTSTTPKQTSTTPQQTSTTSTTPQQTSITSQQASTTSQQASTTVTETPKMNPILCFFYKLFGITKECYDDDSCNESSPYLGNIITCILIAMFVLFVFYILKQ